MRVFSKATSGQLPLFQPHGRRLLKGYPIFIFFLIKGSRNAIDVKPARGEVEGVFEVKAFCPH